MLPPAEQLSGLLGALYDAAANPEIWDKFLQQLAHHTRATSAGLVMIDGGRHLFTISSSWEVAPEATRLYQEYYGALDIWAQRGLTMPAGYVCPSESLWPPSEMLKSELYNDFMKQFGIEHGLFGVLENAEARWASVSLYRDVSCAEFEGSTQELLTFLSPHMQRAFKLHLQFAELKAQSQKLETALDMLPTGIFFLGAKGEILIMNRSASALVAEKDGILATPRGLRAELPVESSSLEKAIAGAISLSNGKVITSGETVRVSRRTRSPLHVLISPIRNSNISGISVGQTIRAVAFVTDASRRPRPTQDILRTLFGLTPAECRVALLLSDGLAPKKIASIIGVSDNTVRAQIKNIFSKTGVNRQGELIRLLLDQFSF